VGTLTGAVDFVGYNKVGGNRPGLNSHSRKWPVELIGVTIG
jgi:hypothetical protein